MLASGLCVQFCIILQITRHKNCQLSAHFTHYCSPLSTVYLQHGGVVSSLSSIMSCHLMYALKTHAVSKVLAPILDPTLNVSVFRYDHKLFGAENKHG